MSRIEFSMSSLRTVISDPFLAWAIELMIACLSSTAVVTSFSSLIFSIPLIRSFPISSCVLPRSAGSWRIMSSSKTVALILPNSIMSSSLRSPVPEIIPIFGYPSILKLSAVYEDLRECWNNENLPESRHLFENKWSRYSSTSERWLHCLWY